MNAPPSNSIPLRTRLYRALLRLYPSAVREEDGQAMEALFADLCEDEKRRRGRLGMLLFSLRSYGEVPVQAWTAHRRAGMRRRQRENPGRGGGFLAPFLQDLRFGLRGLRKSPLSAFVTVLSLGFGIGAVTAAYSLAAGTVFQSPVGLEDPEELVTIYTSREDGKPYGNSSYPDYRSIVEEVDALAATAAFGTRGFTLGHGLATVPLLAEEVSGNFFAVTGIRPVLGRSFLPEEAEPDRPERVVILGHHIWQEHLGGSRQILGRTVRLNGEPFTVVGVGPEGVMSRRVPVKVDAWVPMGIRGQRSNRRAEALTVRNSRPFLLLGRMKEGVGLDQVRAQLSVLSRRLVQEHTEDWTDDRGRPRAFLALPEAKSRLNPGARPLLNGIAFFFLGATGLILLVACSNVATLMVARAGRRRREMAVRVAIGASRLRLVGQLLNESLLLGLSGGAAGVLLALLAVRRLEAYSLPLNVPFNLGVSLDYGVMAFALLVSLGATLMFGLIPGLEASRPSLMPSLKGESRGFLSCGGGRRSVRSRGRSQLVVVQCAASLVLLVGAALFLRTLGEATKMDLGFSTQGVAVMSKTLSAEEGPPTEGIEELRALRERLLALPGVTSAEMSRSLELTLFQAGASASVRSGGPGSDLREGERVLRNSVTPGYLKMLQIPLLRGRYLQEGDGPASPRVAVVNETLAQRLWPGEDPVGRRFQITDIDGWAEEPDTDGVWLTVVGMVRNGTYEDFDDGPIPYFWTSLFQDYASTVAVSLKGAGGSEEMVAVLRDHVELAPGEVPLVYPSTLEGQTSIQFVHLRIASSLLGLGGFFGLVLAAMGLYAVVTMTVTERTREMAIRLALGADGNKVVGSVARRGTNLALVGLIIGLLVGLPLAHLLRGLFFGVGALDPWAIGGGISAMTLVALTASLVPALRVTRIDPMTVLRDD